MVILKEVFKDFEVVVKSASYHSRYHYPMKIVLRDEPKQITLQDLTDHVENLKAKYPDKVFKLMKRKVGGRTYYVITRKSYYRDEQGRRHEVKERVPIYVDLDQQRFFVPKRYVEHRLKLTRYIVMRVLGTLGLVKSERVS